MKQQSRGFPVDRSPYFAGSQRSTAPRTIVPARRTQIRRTVTQTAMTTSARHLNRLNAAGEHCQAIAEFTDRDSMQ